MVLLVSDDAALRSKARHELQTIDERRHVASVSTVAAARRSVAVAAPAVILLTEAAVTREAGDLHERGRRLDVAVSSLATYAPVVVIGDAEHQTELSGLVAAGAADYVVRTDECLTVRLDWSSGVCARPRVMPTLRPLRKVFSRRREELPWEKKSLMENWTAGNSAKCCGMN
jgi:DNA-binding NarL/FixJ family response regulator